MITVVVLLFIICTTIYCAYLKHNYVVYYSNKMLQGKTAVVTGGTSGIGLEIAKDFASRHARVIIACPFEDEGILARKEIMETSGNHEVIYRHLDLASLASVRQFANDILNTEDRLDILVNNAGICMADNFITKDGMNFVMQVNYYGHFLLTLLLLPLLRKTGTRSDPARIINMSSLSHRRASLDVENYNRDKHWMKMTVYFNSKLSLVMFSRELSRRLENCNVVINCADPGVVSSGIYKYANRGWGRIMVYVILLFARSTRSGAQTAIFLAVSEAGKVSGEYFANCKRIRASAKADDECGVKKLWEQSVRLVHLTSEELSEILPKEQCDVPL